MMIGTDSHTPMGGGLGSISVGVGGADAVEVMAGLPWEVLYPRFIGVRLTGEMSGWTAAQRHNSLSGRTVDRLRWHQRHHRVLRPGTSSISATGKATITNMGAELGATTRSFLMMSAWPDTCAPPGGET